MTTWSDGTFHYVAIRSSSVIHVDCYFCFSFDLCDCNGKQFDALPITLKSIKNLGNNRGDFFGWRELVESFTDQWQRIQVSV